MFEYCPRGEECTAFFRASFLRRLPSDIRVMLHGMDSEPLKDLAVRADQLWLTRPGSASMVASEDWCSVSGGSSSGSQCEEPIAAVSRGSSWGSWRGRGGRGGGKPGSGAKQQGAAGGGAGGSGNSSKKQKGTQKMSICWRHRKHGDQAFDCMDPAACQFQVLGN